MTTLEIVEFAVCGIQSALLAAIGLAAWPWLTAGYDQMSGCTPLSKPLKPKHKNRLLSPNPDQGTEP